MKDVAYRFLEPLDVLFLRGNKLFGDPGSFGESLVPPWPSVAAGALRSRILTDDKVDLAVFARGGVFHPTLGTPDNPGSFVLRAFHLARRFADGKVEMLTAPPADLMISQSEGQRLEVRRLSPHEFGELRAMLKSSYLLPQLPVLAERKRTKPAGGYWLTEPGWRKYLAGDTPSADELVSSGALWQLDARVGVGLNPATRSAAEGRLFTNQAVAMVKRGLGAGKSDADFDAGFLVAVAGAEVPTSGMLRFGGDGRAAAVHPAPGYQAPEPDYAAISAHGRCRMILASPGIFPGGWLLPGTQQNGEQSFRFELHGVRARLVAAAVARAETISGWDLARALPKKAQRVAPAGSVYWLSELEAQPADLQRLVERGLWQEPCEDPIRRAEGFNRIWLAQW